MEVQRLVRLDVERDTPLDVLAACREIHPAAELVYVGSGRWWLGYINPTPAMNVGYDPPAGTRFQHELQRQGFKWLGEYGDSYLTPSFLRQELEFMFGRTDEELIADMKFANDHSEGEHIEVKKREAVKQMVQQEGRSIYAHVFRKRRGVLVP